MKSGAKQLLIGALVIAPGAGVAASARVNSGVALASNSSLSLWAAQEPGPFAEHGVDVQLVLIRDGPERRAPTLRAVSFFALNIESAPAQSIRVIAATKNLFFFQPDWRRRKPYALATKAVPSPTARDYGQEYCRLNRSLFTDAA